jgi:hypothetical protein
MSERARIITPGMPSYEAHVALDRRIELALRPFADTPGGRYHASVVARIQRELAAREAAERAASADRASSDAA